MDPVQRTSGVIASRSIGKRVQQSAKPPSMPVQPSDSEKDGVLSADGIVTGTASIEQRQQQETLASELEQESAFQHIQSMQWQKQRNDV